MEKPNTETVAYYDRNVPPDPRAVKGQMFGCRCAFVNGHMFFGTFAQSVVVRVGAARAAELVAEGLRIFEPMAGRAWKEYVQVDTDALPDDVMMRLAQDALNHAGMLPPKEKAPRRSR